MSINVGDIFEGTVTGITNFGVFVALPDGKSGMVHISEVANVYVKDINEFVKDKQTVRVKVIGIDEKGKISLSMKQAAEPVREQKPREEKPAPAREPAKNTPFYADGWTPEITDDVDFEGMMAKFKKQSEEKMSDFKRSRDAKHGSYSRRR
ncbi:MAG: S1 RNA-binding domain-containing protein [Clostridia bacterium]|nr:S1 RNA-binding domain-containing protein [Clostridia bacterium]MBR5768754.1 S1 RNA-binding domain-containing protein [Clostridia bacterium]